MAHNEWAFGSVKIYLQILYFSAYSLQASKHFTFTELSGVFTKEKNIQKLNQIFI